jgi:hypothetical protein
MTQTHETLDDIQRKKDALGHKTFWMALQVLFVFGIPAFVGFHSGNWLNQNTGLAPHARKMTLAIAFILSWLIIIYQYKKLTRSFRALDAMQRELEARE